jgi:OHCU decarboxylase
VAASPAAGLAEQAGTLDRRAFAERFGAVFERSPWVAEAAWAARPFAGLDDLHAKLTAAVRAAPRGCRLALIRAHPDLAGRAAVAGELTPDSTREQAAAGLDRLSPAQHAELTRLNAAYRERFGFPFVICAREHDAGSVIAAAAARLGHGQAEEEETALTEIAKIARLRLEAMGP